MEEGGIRRCEDHVHLPHRSKLVVGDADDGDSGGAAQFLRFIDDQADFMNSLIKGIQDAARKGSGALRVDPSPEGVRNLVEQARDAFLGGDAGRSGVRIDPPPDLAEEVPGEPGPLSGSDDVSRRTARGEPLSILVMADDPQSLRNVRDILTSLGFRACVTSNAHEIPGLLEKHRPIEVKRRCKSTNVISRQRPSATTCRS